MYPTSCRPHSVLPINILSLPAACGVDYHSCTGNVDVSAWVDVWSRMKGMSVHSYMCATNHVPKLVLLHLGPLDPGIKPSIMMMNRLWQTVSNAPEFQRDYPETILALTAISDEP